MIHQIQRLLIRWDIDVNVNDSISPTNMCSSMIYWQKYYGVEN